MTQSWFLHHSATASGVPNTKGCCSFWPWHVPKGVTCPFLSSQIFLVLYFFLHACRPAPTLTPNGAFACRHCGSTRRAQHACCVSGLVGTAVLSDSDACAACTAAPAANSSRGVEWPSETFWEVGVCVGVHGGSPCIQRRLNAQHVGSGMYLALPIVDSSLRYLLWQICKLIYIYLFLTFFPATCSECKVGVRTVDHYRRGQLVTAPSDVALFPWAHFFLFRRDA